MKNPPCPLPQCAVEDAPPTQIRQRARFTHEQAIAASLSHVDESGCWITVQAKTKPNGYGTIRIAKKVFNAHRFTYLHFVGPIPDGLDLDHLCLNRACMNPAHMEPVTRRENILRSLASSPRSRNPRCGTLYAYRLGCHCDPCRAANAEVGRRYREKRNAA